MTMISVYSPTWDRHDSYGILAQQLADSLGGCVNRMGFDTPEGGVIQPTAGGLLLGYPTLYAGYGVLAGLGRRVALTMFESTVLPDGWVSALNGVDHVIVPARFLVEVLRANGVQVPITVIPLAVDDVYSTTKREKRHEYIFLALGDRGRRKGYDVAMQAFVRAFGKRDDVKLIIKARKGGLPGLNISNSNIEIIREDLSAWDMFSLYEWADCMVFPTRGEGFGLPPREFAATGGHVLATGWGGTADDIACWGVPIAYTMAPAWKGHRDMPIGLGEWAEPDVAMLAELMLEAAERRPDNQHGASYVAQTYTKARFAEAVLKVWEGESNGD